MASKLKHTVMPSGGDFTSLDAAIDHLVASHADLVSADVYADIEIDGTWSSADTTAVLIDGLTTDSTRYVNIYTTAAARHAGVWSTSKYQLSVTSNATALNVNDLHVKVVGLQIEKGSNNNIAVYLQRDGDLLDACIVRIIDTEQTAIQTANGASTTATIRNTIVYKSVRNGMILNSSGTVNIQNCTVAGCTRNGLYRLGGTINATNVACIGNGDGVNYFDFSGTITKTNCASTDTTADGTNCETGIAHSTSTFVNVTAGSQNYHLVSGSGLIDQGTDLSGTFTDDIDGETRSGTWDIGADEYVAPAGGSIPRSNPFSRPFSQSLGRGGF